MEVCSTISRSLTATYRRKMPWFSTSKTCHIAWTERQLSPEWPLIPQREHCFSFDFGGFWRSRWPLSQGWGGGGVLPYMGYIGMFGPKGYGFLPVLVWNRVSILTSLVWNRVWFVHSSLELDVFFLKQATFSSSLSIRPSRKALLKLYSNRVRAATACHALRSRARLLGFLNWSWPERSEIGYQSFGQVWNRVGKIADFGLILVFPEKFKQVTVDDNPAGIRWIKLVI